MLEVLPAYYRLLRPAARGCSVPGVGYHGVLNPCHLQLRSDTATSIRRIKAHVVQVSCRYANLRDAKDPHAGLRSRFSDQSPVPAFGTSSFLGPEESRQTAKNASILP